MIRIGAGTGEMPSPICLDSSDALPPAFLKRLESYRHIFQSERYLEEVLREQAVRKIADELEAYLKLQSIRGYHCTREPIPGFFKTQGLRTTNVQGHQSEFLKNFSDKFCAHEVVTMKTAWANYFAREGQQIGRDGKVWVCLTRALVNDSGTEDFTRYFGGEAIFKPLNEMPSILAKLAKIGSPVVVEVNLQGSSLNANYPMSYAVLSNFHVTIRPDAHLYESEAWLLHAVLPADIIRAAALEQFQP